MEKLELKHIAPYLPYSLKMVVGNVRCNIAYISTKNIAIIRKNGIGEVEKYRWGYATKNRIKPILKPLSDIHEEDLEFNLREFVGIREWCDAYNDFLEHFYESHYSLKELNSAPYIFIKYFLYNHFDIFGLIEKGLAIDINTLEK